MASNVLKVVRVSISIILYDEIHCHSINMVVSEVALELSFLAYIKLGVSEEAATILKKYCILSWVSQS